MGNDTFEGWCTAASVGDQELGKYADHTFVYCPGKDASFKCWGSANLSAPDAAKVCSKSASKAYCRANKYRISVPHVGDDTAGVGIYAINGVCHQSANLFLYSAGTTLPLNKSRPKGILASHALFGVYGAGFPGGISTYVTHFAAWNAAIYAQASARCWFTLAKASDESSGSDAGLISKITSLHFERLGLAAATLTDGENVSSSLVPQEMKVLLSHYLSVDNDTNVLAMHQDIIAEKEEIFSAYGITLSPAMTTTKELPQGKDVDEMVKKLNGLALEFQSQLAEKLGTDGYKNINGDAMYYSPIDPGIARQVFDSLTSE